MDATEAGRRTWRKEWVKGASKNAQVSWRLMTGRGDDRKWINLGRVDEDAAERALVNMRALEDRGDGARILALYETDQDAARRMLLGDPAEAALLPAPPVDYGALTVSDYFDQFYWPARRFPAEPGDLENSPIRLKTPKSSNEEALYWRHKGHDQSGNAREKRGILDGAIGATRLRDLTDQLWERWQNEQTQLSPRSKVIRRGAYSALLAFTRRMGHHAYKPEFFRLRGATKRTREQSDPLTPDEVVMLLKVADPMRRAMWAIGVGQGLRPSELVRVQWEDINWAARTMLVRGEKTDLSWDSVPMTPFAYDELRAFWMRLAQPTTGHAFTVGGRGSRTDAPGKVKKVYKEPRPFKNYKKALASDARAAGIERKVYPYLLRHSFATLAYLRDVPKEVTRRIGRWTSDEMLDQVYCRPRPADLVAKAARFDLAVG